MDTKKEAIEKGAIAIIEWNALNPSNQIDLPTFLAEEPTAWQMVEWMGDPIPLDTFMAEEPTQDELERFTSK
jgi:2,3-bisphosphoglycerate-independent phosphoglycerate mutase